jgi:hypothetical protein
MPIHLLRVAVFLIAGTAPLAAVDSYADALPRLREALTPAGIAELSATLDRPLADVSAVIDDEAGVLRGELTLLWPNRSGEALDDLAFHCYPNAAAFQGAALVVESSLVNGKVVERTPSDDGSSLLLRLPEPLVPGATAKVVLRYTLTPSEKGLHGLVSRNAGRWCLYHWYPEPAVRRGGRWELFPASAIGDASATEAHHLLATIEHPAGWSVIATGSGTTAPTKAAGRARTRISAPWTRNSCLVMGPGFESVETACGATTVCSWYHQDDEEIGKRVFTVAVAALEFFGREVAPYPFAELDVVEAPLEEAGGMESSGLVIIDESLYAAARWMPPEAGLENLPVFLVTTATAHEVAHQWWYGMVGSDAMDAPWIDESLTSWATCWFFERTQGAQAGAGVLQFHLMEALMEKPQPGGRRWRVDAPLSEFDQMSFGAVVYGRGALMYQALRQQIGEDAFLAFLRDWTCSNRFGYTDAATWKSCLERHASAEQAESFRRVWIAGEGLDGNKLVQALKPIPH